MTTPRRRAEPVQAIFIGLAAVLVLVLLYFAISLIPSAQRPTLQPSTTASTAVTSGP